MILELIDEAAVRGARRAEACKVLGLDRRTVQRWKRHRAGGDQRRGPKLSPV